MSQQIARGFTFSGTAPNNNVTADKLNALVDDATILPGLYTGAPSTTSVQTADVLLIWQASSGVLTQVTAANALPAARSARGFVGLTATNNVTNPTFQVDISASEIVERSALGGVWHATNFSVTVDATVYSAGATANGRDFASLASAQNTFVYLYAISDGTTDAGLISTSSTSPTLPTGYIYYALIGVLKIDGSNNIKTFSQVGREVTWGFFNPPGVGDANFEPYTFNQAGTPVNAIMDGGTNMGFTTINVFQAIDLSRCVPANATKVKFVFGTVAYHSATNFFLASSASGTVGSASIPTMKGLQMPLLLNQPNAAFKLSSAAGVKNIGAIYQGEFTLIVPQQLSGASSAVSGISDLFARVTGFTLGI